jgi:hypothetical protein
MKLFTFLLYLICLQALLPAHGSVYSRRAGAILRAPFLFGEMRQQGLFEKNDTGPVQRLVESQSIKLFDNDEQLGQSRSANRQDAVSGRLHATESVRVLAEIMLEKLPEVLLQFRYAMSNVPRGDRFDFGGASCRFHRMDEALIGESYPKDEVGKRDRMSTPLAYRYGARGSRRTLCASRHLRLRGPGLFPHPVETLEAESEQSPNESLKFGDEGGKDSASQQSRDGESARNPTAARTSA